MLEMVLNGSWTQHITYEEHNFSLPKLEMKMVELRPVNAPASLKESPLNWLWVSQLIELRQKANDLDVPTKKMLA